MALHGEVKVNGRAVAWWQAVRVNGGTQPDDINRYACAVQRTGSPRWAGTVEHRYGDGAVALAAAVLAAAGVAG